MSVKIKFCGGAGRVTGSMHLVTSDRSSVILDCGIFYGRRDEYYQENSSFPFQPENIDACLLSHAHIDHCGNIPTLIKHGFRSKVHCTPSTRDLCRYMLPDSGYIQEEDIKYVNKINKRRGIPPHAPLYTKKDADKALKHFRALDYHKTLDVAKDMKVTFYEAGHILGSAVVVLEVEQPKRPLRIAYAVDLGRVGMPLLRNPEVPKDIDYLIMESTYGNKDHGELKDAEILLAETIAKTVDRGGKIIIPSFALERTQLIVYFISELIKRRLVKEIPIYVDGPLAVNLTRVFRDNWRYFDEDTQKAFRSDRDPLGYGNITYIRNVNDSKRLNDDPRPSIIISASGMCENGRILHHLKNNIENPKNAIVAIGYMARDTLGRRIVEMQGSVRIFGRPYELKAEVVIIDAFSSHADRQGLVDYAKECSKDIKKVFIVHGESEHSEALQNNLKKQTNLKSHIPAKGEVVSLVV